MEISANQLEGSLEKQLLPVYLIASDEHLLLEESCQLVISYAQQAGFTEKERLIVEKGFSWQQLIDASSNMSLFGEKKIIDLRINNGKPGSEGSDAIKRYLENYSPDNLLLIRCPQLNKQTLNSKWVKAISKTGAHLVIWKVKPPQLPAWIQQRVKQHGISIDRDAAQILAERVEGNLLAASQEIEKLALLYPENSQIDIQQIIQAVSNSSRYDVFSLMEYALKGDGIRALKMLRGLREERTDLTIIAWTMRNEIQTLLKLAEYNKKRDLAKGFKDLRVWQSKQALYSQTLQRLNERNLSRFLVGLADLDKTIKGRGVGSADVLCERILLAIAGTRIPA